MDAVTPSVNTAKTTGVSTLTAHPADSFDLEIMNILQILIFNVFHPERVRVWLERKEQLLAIGLEVLPTLPFMVLNLSLADFPLNCDYMGLSIANSSVLVLS
jgi:hypothetical protein